MEMINTVIPEKETFSLINDLYLKFLAIFFSVINPVFQNIFYILIVIY